MSRASFNSSNIEYIFLLKNQIDIWCLRQKCRSGNLEQLHWRYNCSISYTFRDIHPCMWMTPKNNIFYHNIIPINLTFFLCFLQSCLSHKHPCYCWTCHHAIFWNNKVTRKLLFFSRGTLGSNNSFRRRQPSRIMKVPYLALR